MSIPTSIVIPTYKRPSYLNRVVQCLRAQSIRDFELVLVCQGYSQDYLEGLRQDSDALQIRILSYPGGIGVAKAKNAGLSVAAGDIIVFIDDDVQMDPNWLQCMLAPFGDPSVGAVGGFVCHPGQSRWWKRLYYMVFLIAGSRYVIGKSGFNRGVIRNPGTEQDAEWFPSCNLAVRRAAAQAVGVFDETFHRVYEDVDFTVRIRDLGWRIRFVPDAPVLHYDTVDSSLALPDLVENTEAMRVYFLRKRALRTSDWLPYYLVRLAWHSTNLFLLGLKAGNLTLPIQAYRGFLRGLSVRAEDVAVDFSNRIDSDIQ